MTARLFSCPPGPDDRPQAPRGYSGLAHACTGLRGESKSHDDSGWLNVFGVRQLNNPKGDSNPGAPFEYEGGKSCQGRVLVFVLVPS